MVGTTRWRRGQAARFGWAAILAIVSAMFLAACGGEEAATSLPATARAAATRVAGTAPPNTVATAAAMATAAARPPGQATAGTSGPQATITGEITRVDPAARTFSVRGTDGKDYSFTASANSQVDLAALAAKLASSQQVTVIYRGTGSPYEVVSAR